MALLFHPAAVPLLCVGRGPPEREGKSLSELMSACISATRLRCRFSGALQRGRRWAEGGMAWLSVVWCGRRVQIALFTRKRSEQPAQISRALPLTRGAMQKLQASPQAATPTPSSKSLSMLHIRNSPHINRTLLSAAAHHLRKPTQLPRSCLLPSKPRRASEASPSHPTKASPPAIAHRRLLRVL